MHDLTPQEFEERVAILRRFKATLERQRDRFRRYLDQLERSADGPCDDEPSHLDLHVEMEQSIVRELSLFERSVEPLEHLYREHDPDGAGEIPALRQALQRTRDEVLQRAQANRSFLQSRLESIRAELPSRSVRTRPIAVSGREPSHEPSLVDVTA